MKRRRQKIAIGLCFHLMACSPLAAQQSVDSVRVYDLKEVDVHGIRGRRGLVDVVPVSVVNRRDILNMGITDIADALHRMPGVNLRDYGGAGGVKTIGVRGFGAQHTGVSYDGILLSDIQSGAVDVSRYALDNVASLNLAVGGNSDVFISAREAASAAVFSIETLKELPQDRRVHMTTQLKFGSFGYISPFIYYLQSISKGVTLSANGEYIYAENNYPFVLRNGIYKTREHRNNSRMNSGHGELNVYVQMGRNGKVEGKVYYYDNNCLLPGIVKLYNKINGESLHDRNAFAQIGWQQHTSDELWSWKAKGKFNWSSSSYRDKYYPNAVMDADYWQREAYGSLTLLLCPSDKVSVSYAGDYIFNNLNSSLDTDVRPFRHTFLQTLSVKYTVPHLVLLGRTLYSLYLNSAKRGEHAKNLRRFSPSLSISYQPFSSEQLYIRASYKNIFRAPTFNESYFFHYGSTNLQPELTDQFNLGLTWQSMLWNRLNMQMTLDGYLNHVKDKIVAVPYNMFVWTNVNVGKVDAKGYELSLRGDYRMNAKHHLGFVGSYSYQRVSNHTDKLLPDYGKQIAYLPLHTLSASLKWGNPWIDVVVHGEGCSSRWATNSHYEGTQLKGYWDMGLTLSRAFQLCHGQVLLRGDIKNLLDQQYEIVGNYPMPGISYQFAINYKF